MENINAFHTILNIQEYSEKGFPIDWEPFIHHVF